MKKYCKELLVIIDIQNGFINEYTQDLVDKIVHFINKTKFSGIVATRYINNFDTACYKYEGWKKCMEGTQEIEIINKLRQYIDYVFDKSTYTCWTKEFQEYIKSENYDKVYFVGVNTGCCVLHSAYDCYNSLQDCAVISDLCGSTSGKCSHERALEVLRENITKERVITTEQFYKRNRNFSDINIKERNNLNIPFKTEYHKDLTTEDELKNISKIDIYNIEYNQGYQKAIRDMLDLSYEWCNNHGSFLDFQRVLRSKFAECNVILKTRLDYLKQ